MDRKVPVPYHTSKGLVPRPLEKGECHLKFPLNPWVLGTRSPKQVALV